MKQSEYKALWEKFEEVLAASSDTKAILGKKMFDAAKLVGTWEDRYVTISPAWLRLYIEYFGNPQGEMAKMPDEDFGLLVWKAGKEIEPIEPD